MKSLSLSAMLLLVLAHDVSAGPLTAIYSGARHTCALTSAGGVVCWGDNASGQLGDGTTTTRVSPVAVIGLSSGVAALAAGRDHTCALRTNGAVECWGFGGLLGDGTMTTRLAPVPVRGLAGNVIAIAAGSGHTCAVVAGGALQCWGGNYDGALGDGTTAQRLTAVGVIGLSSGVKSVSGGWGYTCAVTTSGAVMCWGRNTSGGLGDGTTTRRLWPVPVTGMSSGVTAIAAGGGHTCALRTTGAVQCWGGNLAGQVGDGTTTNRLVPVEVNGLSDVLSISTGLLHTCAVTRFNGVQCWGENNFGKLGDGTLLPRATPVTVTGLVNVIAVTAGVEHTCALTASGTAKCWGDNSRGQLGDGTRLWELSPVAAVGLSTGVTDIGAGLAHTCAVIAGAVQCWGNNSFGELGDATTTPHPEPAPVVGLSAAATTVAVGAHHNCALLASGAVECWGYNYDGELGDGTRNHRLTPVPVAGLSDTVIAIGAGQVHTCALTASGAVQCWGSNYGQLGDGTTTDRITPVTVNGLSSGVTALAVGAYHSCAVMASGAVKCWGDNSQGQLGDGTTTRRLSPVQVTGLPMTVNALALGGHHSCALTSERTAYCWGANDYGQAAAGGPLTEVTARAVPPLNDAVRIAAGGQHTCAATSAGALQCWGKNDDGQLGNGTTQSWLNPGPIVMLPGGVVAVAAGDAHTCAVTADGAAFCWGRNADGQLGNGLANTLTKRTVNVPALATDAASAVTHITATVHGTVATEGGAPITLRGACLATTANPGFGATCAPALSQGTGAFSVSFSGLAPGTTYHVRAYATNNQGSFFADETTFTTLPAPLCTGFSTEPFIASPGPLAGSQVVTLIGVPLGCAGGGWTAAGDGAWVTVSPASGTGPGSVTVSWAYNPTPAPRSSAAAIAGNPFPVIQAAAPPSDPNRDFNGDGWMDLVFRHTVTGDLVLWSMAGPIRISSQMLNPSHVSTRWRLAGIGDMNGDGKPDILWQEETAGDLVVWFMDGANLVSYSYLSIRRPADPAWKVVSVADLNGDSKPDLVWQHASSASLAVWLLDGITVTARVIPTPGVVADANWKIVGAADFDGDGKIDLLWKHATEGYLVVWLMDGVTRTEVRWLSPSQLLDLRWQVVATGDLDGDGTADIVFQHADGRMVAWFMDHLTRTRAEMLTPDHVIDVNWRIAGPK